jgi:hypothetical protein
MARSSRPSRERASDAQRGSPSVAFRKALVSTLVAFVVLCVLDYQTDPETFSAGEVFRESSVLLGAILLALFGIDMLRQSRAK